MLYGTQTTATNLTLQMWNYVKCYASNLLISAFFVWIAYMFLDTIFFQIIYVNNLIFSLHKKMLYKKPFQGSTTIMINYY